MSINTVSSAPQTVTLPTTESQGDSPSSNPSVARSFRDAFGGMPGADQSDIDQAVRKFHQGLSENAPNGASNVDVEKLYDLLKSNEDASRKLEQIMEKFMSDQSADRDKGKDGGMRGIGQGGESWLVALAKALGEAMGDIAADMVDLSGQLDGLTGADSEQGAREFNMLLTKLQAKSQMYGIVANNGTNAIKSIGQASSTAVAQ